MYFDSICVSYNPQLLYLEHCVEHQTILHPRYYTKKGTVLKLMFGLLDVFCKYLFLNVYIKIAIY